MSDALPLLFQPFQIRNLRLKNRIVLPPMCQYSATDGVANDWHLMHLGKFAAGGMGLIFTEACAVQRQGRITHGDIGLWNDGQIAPLKRVTDFVKSQGAAAAVQLGHAGRKASMQRPWFGNGPLGEDDFARGDHPWPIKGASPEPVGPGWMTPEEMTVEDIRTLVEDFTAATRRAEAAGFDAVEVHGAHGYLIASFLSPISNKRTDAYGSDRAGRMRVALEVTEAVRGVWDDDKPLFFRISAVDGAEGGWGIEDSVVLAKELKALGVDVIDCSSGGIGGSATAGGVKRGPGFQVPFSDAIHHQAAIATEAVGLILDGAQAEQILQEGKADLIAVGREALYNPHWALHAARELGCDEGFRNWPNQYGWWLDKREQSFNR